MPSNGNHDKLLAGTIVGSRPAEPSSCRGADGENETTWLRVASWITKRRDFNPVDSQRISKGFSTRRQTTSFAYEKAQARGLAAHHLYRRTIVYLPSNGLENRQKILCVAQRILCRGMIAEVNLLVRKLTEHPNEHCHLKRSQLPRSRLHRLSVGIIGDSLSRILRLQPCRTPEIEALNLMPPCVKFGKSNTMLGSGRFIGVAG